MVVAAAGSYMTSMDSQSIDCLDVSSESGWEDSNTWLPIVPQPQHELSLIQAVSPIPSTSHQNPPTGSSAPTSMLDLLQVHHALMNNKANMDRRTFNKNALHLLNQAMGAIQHVVYSHAPSPLLTQPAQSPGQWNNLKEALGEFRHLLLNAKEMGSEELVERVIQYICQTLSPLLTADEKRQELEKKCLAFVHDLSPQLSLKVGPLIKSCIQRQFGMGIEDMLAEVRLPEMSVRDKATMYTRMLNNFLEDASSISFACSNRRLLGNVLPVDLWFLTFFAFVTSKRCRGDNLLMLGCVGKCCLYCFGGDSLFVNSLSYFSYR